MKRYQKRILAFLLGAMLLVGETVLPVSAEEVNSSKETFFSQEDLETDVQKVLSNLPQKEEVDHMSQEELTELREDMLALRDQLNNLTQEEYASLTGTDSAMDLLNYVLEKATAGDEPVGGVIKDENHKVGLVEENNSGLMRSAMASRYVPAVGSLPLTRSQNPHGTCWAFASIAGVEGDVIKTYGVPANSVDLSEAHLTYFTYFGDCQPYANTADKWLNGGNYSMSSSALLHWIGAAQESVAPYQNLVSGFNPGLQYRDAYHVQGYYEFNIKENPNVAKQMILEHGMIGVTYYAAGDSSGGSYYNNNTVAYYYNGTESSNHAVAVVGWDDNFSKSNFNNSAQPSRDGAWLVRNTWASGADVNDMGYATYFWMSYEDTGLDKVAVAFDAEPADNYDTNYQYDDSQMSYVTSSATGAMDFAQIYSVPLTSATESLKAVGVYIGTPNTKYQVQIYKGFNSATNFKSGTKIAGACASGEIDAQGFYTIPLEQAINVKGGEKFAVEVCLENSTSRITVGAEDPDIGGYTAGQSVFCYDGTHWMDIGMNFVLKVYSDVLAKANTVSTTCKVSYQLNGGTNHKSNLSQYNKGTNVTLYDPTRSGYVFNGWYTNANFSGTPVKTISNISGNYTLYAKWTPIQYKVKFNKNGLKLKGSFSTKTYKYNSKYTLPKTSTKKKGYDLVWNTKKNGKGTSYKAGSKITNLTSVNGKTITLYARWVKHQYTVTYKLNGGKNGKNPKTYYITTKTIKLKNPTRKGYKFMGWYSDKKCKKKVTQIKKGTTGNKTLYAKWKKK